MSRNIIFQHLRSGGFTLIEALISLLLIGVIVQITVNLNVSVVEKNLINKNLSELNKLSSEIDFYYAKNANVENFNPDISQIKLTPSTLKYMTDSGISLSIVDGAVVFKIPDNNPKLIHALRRNLPHKFNHLTGYIHTSPVNKYNREYSGMLRLDGSESLASDMDLRGLDIDGAESITTTNATIDSLNPSDLLASAIHIRSPSGDAESTRLTGMSDSGAYWNLGGGANLGALNTESGTANSLTVESAIGASVGSLRIRDATGFTYRDINFSGESAFGNLVAGEVTAINAESTSVNYTGQNDAVVNQLSLLAEGSFRGSVTGRVLNAGDAEVIGSSSFTATNAVYASRLMSANNNSIFVVPSGTSVVSNLTLDGNLRTPSLTTVQLQGGDIRANRTNARSANFDTLQVSNLSTRDLRLSGLLATGALDVTQQLETGSVSAGSAEFGSLEAGSLSIGGTLSGLSVNAPAGTTNASTINAQQLTITGTTNRIDPSATTSVSNITADNFILPSKIVNSACGNGEFATDGLGNFLTCKSGRYTAFSASSGGTNNISRGVFTQNSGTWGNNVSFGENTYTSESLIIKKIVTVGRQYANNPPIQFTNPIPSGYTVVSCTQNTFGDQTGLTYSGGHQSISCSSTRSAATIAVSNVDWSSWVYDDSGGSSEWWWLDQMADVMANFNIVIVIIAIKQV